jgi:hypothetical protein
VNSAAEPVAPDFKLRHLGNPAYAMSVITGAVGQVLFLGDEFGGAWWAYGSALGLAAFAEAVMVSAGDKSLYHRAHGHSWVPMLAVAVAVALYAGGMNIAHFLHENMALAFTFGGASVIGFAQHIIDGHIKVSAYLKAVETYRATPPATPKTPRSARTPAAAREATAPTAAHSPAVGAPPPALDPNPSTLGSSAGTHDDTNVRSISTAKGLSQREQVWQWFVEQVEAASGDVTAVTGPDLVKQFGSEHLKKKISDLRRRYENERGSAAVNE